MLFSHHDVLSTVAFNDLSFKSPFFFSRVSGHAIGLVYGLDVDEGKGNLSVRKDKIELEKRTNKNSNIHIYI